jgi:hypothetical protein
VAGRFPAGAAFREYRRRGVGDVTLSAKQAGTGLLTFPVSEQPWIGSLPNKSSLGFSRARLLGVLLLLLLALSPTGAVRAGSGEESSLVVAPEHDQDQQTGPDLQSPRFKISLTLPLLLTDNAQQTERDVTGTAARHADAHFNPDLELKLSQQFAAVKLTAIVDGSVDRFFTQSDEDEDTLEGSFKASFGDGTSDLFVPFAAYRVTADLRPDFGAPDDVLQNFSAGFSSGTGFDAAGRNIPLRDAEDPGDLSIEADVSGGRRLADPRDFENDFVTARVDVGYVLSPVWTIDVTPKLRARRFDDFEGSVRRDLRLSIEGRAAWTPVWLTHFAPSAEIDFAATFLRNLSNLPTERFSQFEGGPSLILVWRF